LNARSSSAPPSGSSSRPSPAAPAPGSPKKNLVLVLAAVAVVVVALFVVAVVLGGDGDGEEAGDVTVPGQEGAIGDGEAIEVAAVTVEGTVLPEFPDGGGVPDPADDPAVGQVAPTLTGVSFDGSPVAVTADGTPKLVLFVAHWCPHCQREIPKVQELVDEGGLPSDVRIVAVSTAVRPGEGNFPPSQWLAEEGWTSPVLLDDADATAALAWALPGFPYGVYVDGENRVVARTSGEVDTETIEQLLQQLSQP
jgi:cytochrome c biogenesis protein CcmG, thiol:disulfide interchange protein DsbE